MPLSEKARMVMDQETARLDKEISDLQSRRSQVIIDAYIKAAEEELSHSDEIIFMVGKYSFEFHRHPEKYTVAIRNESSSNADRFLVAQTDVFTVDELRDLAKGLSAFVDNAGQREE